MNIARMIHALKNNSHEHFVTEISYQDSFADSTIDYVPLPSIWAWWATGSALSRHAWRDAPLCPRIWSCWRHYSMGQGIGWADVAILRHNGFYVEEVGNYENMFKMVAAGRFDLLCRGINELFGEYEAHKEIHGSPMTAASPSTTWLPRFSSSITRIRHWKERIKVGLQRAYADGSLQRLWLEEYQSSIDAADLAHRHLFKLENPVIKSLKLDHQRYSTTRSTNALPRVKQAHKLVLASRCRHPASALPQGIRSGKKIAEHCHQPASPEPTGQTQQQTQRPDPVLLVRIERKRHLQVGEQILETRQMTEQQSPTCQQ